MNCLPCFNNDDDEEATDPPPPNKGTPTNIDAAKEAVASSSKAKTFTFRELAMATKNFRQECLLGEGGFGRVFKGKLHSTGQVVAVKQLDRNGMQGNKEFLVEVLMLSLIQHTNLVSLIGYCADGDQRLLVYEYLSMGSLENQLFGDDPEKKPMDWYTRMKIASGAANGLEYLHDKANPPIVYRDLKPSNILLDENFEPKLSDFGLAKLGAGGGKMAPASRVMGTYGYSAPEYSSGGEHTLKSDIYCFGVVLLELITGRRAIDTTRPNNEQNLVTWAQPIFRDPKRFPDLADPKLQNAFPVTSLNQAVGICAMCLQEEPSVRPLISDVVAALSFLAIPQPITAPSSDSPSTHSPPSEQKMQYETEINLSEEAPQSEPGSSHYDDRSSGNSESSGIENESVSVSDPPNEGSSESYSMGDKSGSSRYSERESECQDLDRRHSSDISEEQIIYTSDSDSGGEDITYNDADTRELDDTERSTDSTANDSLYSAKSNDSSLQSDAGNKSSKHGSSRRSSPTNKTGSRRRKPVVTFKEPSLSGKLHGTIKPKEETSSSDNTSNSINKVNHENNDNGKRQTVIPAATDSRKPESSSSSSSESSSESEDERSPKKDERRSPNQDERGSSNQDKKRTPKQDDRPSEQDERSPRHEGNTRKSRPKNASHGDDVPSIDKNEANHRVFEQVAKKDGPKLRHLKTR